MLQGESVVVVLLLAVAIAVVRTQGSTLLPSARRARARSGGRLARTCAAALAAAAVLSARRLGDGEHLHGRHLALRVLQEAAADVTAHHLHAELEVRRQPHQRLAIDEARVRVHEQHVHAAGERSGPEPPERVLSTGREATIDGDHDKLVRMQP